MEHTEEINLDEEIQKLEVAAKNREQLLLYFYANAADSVKLGDYEQNIGLKYGRPNRPQ